MKIFYAFNLLLIPAVMLLFGWFSAKHPPTGINGFYGYRTPRSRKSKEAWLFAQVDFGKRWVKWGIALLIASAVCCAFLPMLDIDAGGWLCTAVVLGECALMCIPIFFTERALKAHFNDDGTPKQEVQYK